MKLNFTCVRFLSLFFFSFLAPLIFKSNGLWGQNTGIAAGVPTFQCIGITWSGSGGSASTVCNVQYRIAGSGSPWSNGYPLTFDTRAAGNGTTAGRPANEYRGSLVNLTPGTTYEILLSLQGNSAINTFTCTTWSETFPIGVTNIVPNSSTTLNITSGGSASAYQLYTPAVGNTATIDVNNGSTNCIYVNAAYVVIRGLILKGARVDAIKLGPNAHDVVIENNDISGWGTIMSDGWGQNGDAAIRVNYQRTVERIIVQRNKIHHPRTNSNSWQQNRPLYGSAHPIGALAVNFETAGGNHVFRYNEIYSDATHYFMDGIGGAENFEFEGFPRANSDVYGNKVSHAWDDAIECEGGNMNVRIWGNYMDSTFVKIAVAATAIGPVYIFRNVANFARRSAGNASVADNEDRGPFIKAGSQDALYRGGKIFVFHNTVLQPVLSGHTYTLGCGAGILDAAGGPMTPVVSRNNILQIHKNWWQSIGDNFSGQTSNSFNYDLYNGAIAASGGQEANGWSGAPVYNTGNPAGVWALATTSKGYNTGAQLNNFNDGYVGTGPDAGAYEAGAPPLEFGVNAYTGNIAPIANAGSNITLTLPVNSTTLTGSGSDADGTIAGYAWTRVSGPATFTLAPANTATTALTGLVQGTYVFRLTVTDNGGMTGTDDITVTVNAGANQAPTANAGNNITLTLPANSTTLNGSGTDADGTIASYAWTRVSGPTTFTFGTANAASTTLTGLVQGTYTFRLTVTDNSGATGTDDVTVTVNAAANQLPTANAGNNIVITLPVNSTTLTGSGTDPDGTITGYAWTRVSGPVTYTLGTANAATTALTGLVQGTYVFRLTVTDNSGATATDDVNVTVNAAVNQLPSANAGNNITLTLPINSTTLNGIGTDADGTITGYAWTRVSGPVTYTLGTANAAITTLTGLIQGTYVFRLTVTDNSGATATDDVNVMVNAAPNQLPTANAGNNIVITLPVALTILTGSGTDPDGTIVSYSWSRVSGPTSFLLVTLNAATTSVINLVQGTYVFRLTVTDNSGATATDDVSVIVNAALPINQAPIANAGANIIITLPVNSTSLNGSGTDADGTITGYAWTRVSGPTTYALGTANAATTALTGLVQGTYVFRLTVMDNNGATATDDVNVIVNPAPPINQAPVANAGANIIITLPVNSTSLNGSSSTDPDGTITGYAWTRVSGPATYTFGTANAATTTLTGLVQGTYTFRLTVTDNNGATATDDVTVTVNAPTPANQPPIANAGTNITISLPVNSTSLNGSGSTDPDGTITGYAWTRVSGPTIFTLGNANASATALTGLVQGTYVFRLTVTDNGGATDIDNIVVTVNAAANQPPSPNAGNNITLTLPVNSTTLNGSATDIDGTIIGYVWSRVSGPTAFMFGTANAAATTLTNLVQGTYVFRLTVSDNGGAIATDDIIVTVNPAPIPNQPPVARAGNDIVMSLPANSTTLNGNASTDANGTIVSYSWSKISGPTSYTFTSAGSTATGLNNLVQGVYVFRLTVTDNNGTSSTDNITVTVNAAPNMAPLANAGNDIIVTLPVNYGTLSGSGIDPDGIVIGYTWSRISGPAAFTLANANAPTTALSNLVQGVYVFRLTVRDNTGATGTDNVTVVVNAANPPSNQAPIANAGPDRTLTLPVNATTLVGSGMDVGGTIVAYNWTRVSGPTMFLVSNGSAASTGLSNLVQGVYVFRLTVMDNYGLTATDNVTVTVNAAIPGANQPPVARTTADSIVLTLPVNSTSLNGSLSTDADGIITNWEWIQESGPTAVAIANRFTANAQVANLVVGTYIFRLEVTDDDGAVGDKLVHVIVKNSNGSDTYFNIYPNPTSSYLTLQYIDNVNGRFRISIYDVTRRLLLDRFVDKNQALLSETMDVRHFRNGLYFIQLLLPDGKTIGRQFIKR